MFTSIPCIKKSRILDVREQGFRRQIWKQKFKDKIICLGREEGWSHEAFDQLAKGVKNRA